MIMAANEIPDLCETLHGSLKAYPTYVSYDPEKEQALPSRFQATKRTFLLPHQINEVWPVGWGQQLFWHEFRDDYRDKMTELISEGLVYDRSYVIYKGSLALFGEYVISRVYLLKYLGLQHGTKLPRLFMKEDGSSLAELFNGLGASDLVRYGPHGFPIVRKPGHVTVYKISAPENQKDVPLEKKKFGTEIVCQYYVAPDGESAN